MFPTAKENIKDYEAGQKIHQKVNESEIKSSLRLWNVGRVYKTFLEDN